MLALQEELTSTENKISFARQAFNDSAIAYNNQRQVFPAVMVANMMGFAPAELLQAEEAAPGALPDWPAYVIAYHSAPGIFATFAPGTRGSHAKPLRHHPR